MKKLLALLLALFCFCPSALAGCADDAEADTETDPSVTTVSSASTTSPASDVTTAQPEETGLTASIPEVDYKGHVFNIANGFHNDTKYTTNAIAPNEPTGDVLNDAIYRRTLTVEEKLDIDVVDLDLNASKMKTSIDANEQAFDLMTVNLSDVRSFINKGVVLDFHNIPNIDLEKPWWDQNAQEKLSVDGKLFYTFSDFLITGMDNGRAVYFNKQLHKDLELEDLYTLAREGKWTLDKMREMGLQAVSDLNGDQKFDAEDRYGMLCWNATSFYEAYLTASDAEIMKQGKNGIPYFYCYDERFYDVCARLLDVFNTDNFTHLENKLELFMENKALFTTWTLYGATRLRAMDTDFGILPLPKYDEKQESYWHVSPAPHALMVPSYVEAERTGVILEALAYYSSTYAAGDDSVTMAYFEKAVKGKTTRDADSLEMLDIIKNSISYIIKLDDTGMTSSIYGLFGSGRNSFSTVIAKFRNMAEKKLGEAFANMGVTGY